MHNPSTGFIPDDLKIQTQLALYDPLHGILRHSMRYLYLHGFASGSRSRKAQAFRSALAAQQIELEIPDLDEGDFEHLTITGQLKVIERTLAGEPARFIGSSLGAYLGALYASTHPEVDRLVMLAPAFAFAKRWDQVFGPAKIEAWRKSGWLDVFHFVHLERRRVHFGMLEDAKTHPLAPVFTQPGRIFHGIHDAVVPIAVSREYAALHPNTTLTEFDSDHELLNVLPEITAAAVPFLIDPVLIGPVLTAPFLAGPDTDPRR
jgi:pimeloyl-ACP methyl ester carboxylesterase